MIVLITKSLFVLRKIFAFQLQLPIVRLIIVGIATLILVSCGDSDNQGEWVARVYDKKLSKLEVLQSIPYGSESADSARIAAEYIDQWIKKMLVLYKAEQNLDEEQKDVTKKLEDYRIALITFSYEQELINQKIDTAVTKEEVETYYYENQKNFELKKNIIRLKYVKVPENAPNKDKISNWLNADDQNAFDKLEQYCKLYAANYLLNDQSWLFYDEILKEIPLQDFSTDQFNRGRTLLQISNKGFIYFVKVKAFMMKDSRSPLNFEYENIKNIILNQRRLNLIKQMQNDVYNEALNNNEIEIYQK